MQPIKFPQQTHTLAENQPPYKPLPVYIEENNPSVPMSCCFELSADELAEINATGKLWYTQLTFGNSFHPMWITTLNPFD